MCELHVHFSRPWHSLLSEQPVCIQHVAGVCGTAEVYRKLLLLLLLLLLSAGPALRCARQLADCCAAFRHRYSLFTCLSYRPKMPLGKESLPSLWPPFSQVLVVVTAIH